MFYKKCVLKISQNSQENTSGGCFYRDNLLETQQQRVNHATSIIVGRLNIYSIQNKFVLAESIIKTCDLFLTAKSKLNGIFPINQFRIRGYKIFRHDRNRFRGSLMLSINNSISCRPLSDDPIFFCFGTWQLRLTKTVYTNHHLKVIMNLQIN